MDRDSRKLGQWWDGLRVVVIKVTYTSASPQAMAMLAAQ